ncbi:ino eighty subunit 1 [Westerdykella ornata]|uniref:Ino eighty subunit 1 n=1 Tax=Westerdykella ornata TaxID=318751 RepID=A0A6A6JW98_WESOR|nr:ino eighty subunit 1 [Westerdykella ornata]KAF2280881.1 ino eighty subunit 1 [Westerdykella ornata]
MDPSSPVAAAPPRDHHEQTPKTSLRHILASEPDMEEGKPSASRRNSPGPEGSAAAHDDMTKDDVETQPSYRATTTTTRRNANGTVSSVYAGNKIRHLKKDDGIPLWRKDIQYDFLRYVFEDDKRVFHKVTDGPGGELHTFADIYLDAMANSSKCSKILKDKLLSERPAAVNMAMVCLLVNVGRMNTTLNFFPEMRAQLRTYHSIPSLQAHQDPNAYKQLQDAPRLKSILKGASEDVEQPNTIEDIKKAAIPRTNPVNLIFVLSQYAPKISEIHFFPPRDFFDLVMRPSLSSRSRATAFLWLMWWYLESNFTKEDALNNPFGPGQYADPSDSESGAVPVKCPPFEILTPEQEALENVDTPDEKNFGEEKRKERIAILQSDMAPVVTGPKRSGKRGFTQNPVFSVLADDGATTPGKDRQSPSHGSARGRGKLAKSILERDYPSDTDRTRSASPPGSVIGTAKKGTPNMRINTLINDGATTLTPAPKGPGRGNWSRKPGGSARGAKTRLDVQGTSQEGQSPLTSTVPPVSTYTGPHGFYLPLNGSDPSHKRTRPLTAHQLAVEQFRRRRVDVILDRGLRAEYERARKRRRGESSFLRSWVRCKGMTDGYDTDEESNIQALQQADIEHGSKQPPPMFAGLLPLNYGGEVNDYGEEAYWRRKMISRVVRRDG